MGLWVVYLLLAGLAVAVVAVPLLKRAKAPEAVETPPGGGGEATPVAEARHSTRGRLMTLGGVAAVLAAAVAIYLATDDKPPTSTAPAIGPGPMAAAGALPDVDTMISRLAQRLEASPNDPEGWRMLGWSYFATQHYPEAVRAYAKAVALTPGDAGFQSAYGEAQVKAAGDRITPQAEAAFRAALKADATDERARVYMARLRHQKGDSQGALDELFAILKAAAQDSPMAPTIREAIRKVAADSGVDVSDRLPPEAVGPTPADVQAAQQMPAQDQQAMIDGMVGRLEARLATSPRDLDGWIMLIRSRKKLGQDDLAKAALAKAMGVFSDDAAARTRLGEAARELGVG
jgi:cytochrome c-type biogenesis protein CcmH